MDEEQKQEYSRLLENFLQYNSQEDDGSYLPNELNRLKGKSLEELVTYLLQVSGNIFEVKQNLRTSTNEIDQVFHDHVQVIEMPVNQSISYPAPPTDDGFSNSVLDCVDCDAYICSFSEKEDSLDMWRYYSKGNGGYGLKCSSALFDTYKEYEDSEYDEKAQFSAICACKVIYDSKQKECIMKELLLDTYQAYLNIGQNENDSLQDVNCFLRNVLRHLQYQFKHECFASEQEYRFVFYRPRTQPRLLKNELPCVHYRKQQGVLVPYLDIEIDTGTSVLEEVWISPFVETKNAAEVINNYLSQCGFVNCGVRASTLPVRK
jgi:hypothetical protein